MTSPNQHGVNPLDCSLVIPLFNKEDQIDRTLNSIKTQSIPFQEIIVVNDYSTDDSNAKVKDFIRNNSEIKIQLLQHQKNLGVSQARNTGLTHCNSSFICFLDADDILEGDATLNLNEALNKHNFELGMLIFKTKEQKNEISRPNFERLSKLKCTNILDKKTIEINDWASAMTRDTLFCSGGNVLFSKKLLECRFDMSMRNFEDWDFYFRMCLKTKELKLKILLSDHIGLIYTEDDVGSLSRARTIHHTMYLPPPLTYNDSIPLKVRKFTTGIWLIHVAQRSNISNGIRFIKQAITHEGRAIPTITHLVSALVTIALPTKAYTFLKTLRKRFKYD